MQQRQELCVQNCVFAQPCPLFTQTKSWCFKAISTEHCLLLSSRKMMPPCENSTEAYSYLAELALPHNKRLLITSEYTAVMTFKLLEDFFSLLCLNGRTQLLLTFLLALNIHLHLLIQKENCATGLETTKWGDKDSWGKKLWLLHRHKFGRRRENACHPMFGMDYTGIHKKWIALHCITACT